MIKKTLLDIHRIVNGLNEPAFLGNTEIQGVTIDSRKIGKGNLFVPFKGERQDGHDFVEQAIQDGASAAFWEKDVPNPPDHLPIIVVEDTLTALQTLAKSYRNELNMKVIGITGSNGKTTTKDMTAAILGTVFKVHKTSGNYNNHLGLPLTILSMAPDTEAAVLEMGMSSRGEITFLSELARPDIAIITNIGESHLLDLGSREGIAEAKLEILDGLKENGILIYHGDEPLLSSRLKDPQGFSCCSFGRVESNDLFPISIEAGQTETRFEINTVKDTVFTIPVLGTHNVLNSLAAISAAMELGVPVPKIQEGLKNLELTAMRMEMVKGIKGETIINDAYNASPTSMKAAIELTAGISGFDHKYLVLGDMLELGPEEEDFHYKIGELIDPASISKVYTYGPLGKFIAEGAKQKFSEEHVSAYDNKSELIEDLKKTVSSNDLILFKASRGMQLEHVVQSLQSK
ncbi:UDP-N-acetylmuramoyl-tripeptide--D-alanyl-D-alanine ligase [Peribacillus deserti]|uniref:UDP-N-acetylmuramoyl-tripeptide--D-alanyl-D-alanine ligase n=1 Tax=Peribacillus deserti TaxID=673318 RepID=A0ABS2QN41_9BACI|nr:UDP-N-acetylmuramoyl-tripeptide--D-alanyl-D-alanine ligase [Peribacillus deserti]MBM7694578.1 UDP-N-acetylmuramoyl-tripeptide--D-alanyl-D-alanine ligase [Peribacillus deserti]